MTDSTGTPPAPSAEDDVRRGERFAFGLNWQRYLEGLDARRISSAEASLASLLEVERLDGVAMLDIGSGSGIFSLAGHRLGATITSFDFDRASVAATEAVRSRHGDAAREWRVLRGSVLDRSFMESLGQFDLVYSWGVLHHTGQMWTALRAAAAAVRPGGRLCIAIYNDQGMASRAWRAVKRAYCAAPGPLKPVVFWIAMLRLWGPTTVKDLLRLSPFATWRAYEATGTRGMTPMRDAIDWIGGYPFEVASRDAIVAFFKDLGFTTERVVSAGTGLACNEFVFRQTNATAVGDRR